MERQHTRMISISETPLRKPDYIIDITSAPRHPSSFLCFLYLPCDVPTHPRLLLSIWYPDVYGRVDEDEPNPRECLHFFLFDYNTAVVRMLHYALTDLSQNKLY